MMFDLNRTIKLATGALIDREATWQRYLPEAGDWKKTAVLLTGPLIVASAIVSYLLSLAFADSAMFPMLQPTILSTVGTIIMGAIAAGIVAFIFSALAGTFGGKSSFALGLAATTLAFVPGYLGQALSWLPWIGGLLALGLAIFALVQLWKIIPLYLEVPDGKRTTHYIVSIVVTIIVMLIIGRIVNPIIYGSDAGSPFDALSRMESSSRPDSSENRDGGMFNDISRRAAIIAEAQEDAYTPPVDGRLTEEQVQTFASVMQTVAEESAAKVKRMEELARKADEDEQMSASDFGAMMSGMSEIGGLGTTAIEIVKSDGGNWAEHQWVQQALFTASRQKDINDTVAHNFSLFEKYADQLALASW
jgi:hypothetical protein